MKEQMISLGDVLDLIHDKIGSVVTDCNKAFDNYATCREARKKYEAGSERLNELMNLELNMRKRFLTEENT